MKNFASPCAGGLACRPGPAEGLIGDGACSIGSLLTLDRGWRGLSDGRERKASASFVGTPSVWRPLSDVLTRRNMNPLSPSE